MLVKLLILLIFSGIACGYGETSDLVLDAVMPPLDLSTEDEYLCTTVDIPLEPMKLVGIESLSKADVVHHMLLFGCATSPPKADGNVWKCMMRQPCGGGQESVLYGWGKNAPEVNLPEGVGFTVGPGTAITSVVLQVHYLKVRPHGDASGVRLAFSRQPVPYSAGMVAYASSFVIPPGKKSFPVPNTCCYNNFEPMKAIGYRVHTHAMGERVALDRSFENGDKSIAHQDPQLPQGFYPLGESLTILPGDKLKATCLFNSVGQTKNMVSGHTSKDEMCNLYLMLYSHLPYFSWCVDNRQYLEIRGPGGISSSATMVREKTLWTPPKSIQGGRIGQIPGVASGQDGSLWLLHRSDRAWGGNTFDKETDRILVDKTEILVPVLLHVDGDTGTLLSSYGAGVFALPHMVTVDYEGNVWVTDVGLHQVIKLSQTGDILMKLGTERVPGAGESHFCKPTHVAISRSGTIFVGDGYCNSRVVQFMPNGTFEREYTLPGDESLRNPHSLAIDECENTLYVADREAASIHAFDIKTGTIFKYGSEDVSMHGLPYSIKMGPYGSLLALVWDRQFSGKSKLLMLTGNEGIAGVWDLPGVDAPHDFALLPAPLGITGVGERQLSLVVVETRQAGQNSLAHKLVLLPPEVEVNHDDGDDGDRNATIPEGLAASHWSGHVHVTPTDHAERTEQVDAEKEYLEMRTVSEDGLSLLDAASRTLWLGAFAGFGCAVAAVVLYKKAAYWRGHKDYKSSSSQIV